MFFCYPISFFGKKILHLISITPQKTFWIFLCYPIFSFHDLRQIFFNFQWCVSWNVSLGCNVPLKIINFVYFVFSAQHRLGRGLHERGRRAGCHGHVDTGVSFTCIIFLKVYGKPGCFSSDSYFSPASDDQQDLTESSFKRENGWNIMKFKKKLDGGDTEVQKNWFFTKKDTSILYLTNKNCPRK